MMRRREFITLLGGAAAWPFPARAQQRERIRSIGVFMPGAADDPEYQARNAALLQGLGELGWIVGRNLRIEYRWGAGDVERYRALAGELVALSPDVLLAVGFATVGALQKATRSVPIVFMNVTDPVGGGLIASLARPGGNTTGFTSSEFGFAGKWLELLKEIAPRVTRVAVLRDSAIASQIALFGGIQSVAPSLGVELRPIGTRDAGEIEDVMVAFAREPNGGLIAASGAGVIKHRELIVTLAARYGCRRSMPIATTLPAAA
jgi:putative ABC transport system substrate-binding protein